MTGFRIPEEGRPPLPSPKSAPDAIKIKSRSELLVRSLTKLYEKYGGGDGRQRRIMSDKGFKLFKKYACVAFIVFFSLF